MNGPALVPPAATKPKAARWWLSAILSALAATSTTSVAQTLTTVAGSPAGSYADGQQATQTKLGSLGGIAVDAAGNLYLAEGDPVWRVRKVAANGVISTIAGSGQPGYNGGPLGDGGSALAVSLDPRFVAVDAAGSVYFHDYYRSRIRKVTPAGVITTYGGGGAADGDGIPATSAYISSVKGMSFDAAGNLLISDGPRLRKIGTNGIITTIANQANVVDFSGDGGLATAAKLRRPAGVIAAPDGSIYSADMETHRVRRIGIDGIINTVAGGGSYRFDPVATKVQLRTPQGIAADQQGNLVLTTTQQVWQMSATGIMRLVAGRFCDSIFSDKCPTNPTPLFDLGNAKPAFGQPVVGPSDVVFFFDSQLNRVYRLQGLGSPPTPAGVGAFEPFLTIPIDGETRAVRIADVTGDGRRDLVVFTHSSPGRPDDLSLLVFVQNQDGSLAPAHKAKIGTGIPDALGVFDFNGDGIADILVGTVVQELSSPKLLVFDGNADATLAPRVLDSGYLTGPLYELDVDHDGKLDVVGAGYIPGPVVSNGIRWLRGDGQGGIQGDTFVKTVAAGAVVRGDFNADGLDDFANVDQGTLEIVPQLPGGGFGTPRRQTAPGLHRCCSSAAVGDFNHDGRDDLVLGGEGNSPVWVYFYLQDAGGKLEGPRLQPVYDSPGPVSAGDINGDGRDDLVVMHIAWNAIGYLQQTAQGLSAEVKFLMPPYTSIFDPMLGQSLGDLDNDGCKDVAIADYNYGAVIHYGQNCAAPARIASDLDGDGQSDLLSSAPSDARLAWLAGAPEKGVGIPTAAGWAVAAVDDFDGDRMADVLWRQCASGRTRIQAGLHGSARPGATVSDRAWALVGHGDLDGDGKADAIWQRGASGWVTAWPAAQGRREHKLGRAPGSAWSLAGVGDIDGDGRADLFWHQARTGETAFWPAGDARRAWRGAAMQDLAWQPVGLGDLDGNGRADIVWRHRLSGANQAWMDGRLAQRRVLGSVADLHWEVVALADFDGDRRADVFWHHRDTGANRIWKGGDSTTPIQPGKGQPGSMASWPTSCSAPAARTARRF